MSWGIAPRATENEKIKAEFADFLHGLNSCAKIDYETYSKIFDVGMSLLDRMHALCEKQDQWHDFSKDRPPEKVALMLETWNENWDKWERCCAYFFDGCLYYDLGDSELSEHERSSHTFPSSTDVSKEIVRWKLWV